MLPARSPESSASPSSPFINAHVSSNDHLRIPPHSVDALQWTTLIPDSIYPVPYDSDCWRRAHQIRKTCGCLKERFNSLEPELSGQVLLCFQQHRRQRFRDNWQLDHFEASQAVPRWVQGTPAILQKYNSVHHVTERTYFTVIFKLSQSQKSQNLLLSISGGGFGSQCVQVPAGNLRNPGPSSLKKGSFRPYHFS